MSGLNPVSINVKGGLVQTNWLQRRAAKLEPVRGSSRNLLEVHSDEAGMYIRQYGNDSLLYNSGTDRKGRYVPGHLITLDEQGRPRGVEIVGLQSASSAPKSNLTREQVIQHLELNNTDERTDRNGNKIYTRAGFIGDYVIGEDAKGKVTVFFHGKEGANCNGIHKSDGNLVLPPQTYINGRWYKGDHRQSVPQVPCVDDGIGIQQPTPVSLVRPGSQCIQIRLIVIPANTSSSNPCRGMLPGFNNSINAPQISWGNPSGFGPYSPLSHESCNPHNPSANPKTPELSINPDGTFTVRGSLAYPYNSLRISPEGEGGATPTNYMFEPDINDIVPPQIDSGSTIPGLGDLGPFQVSCAGGQPKPAGYTFPNELRVDPDGKCYYPPQIVNNNNNNLYFFIISPAGQRSRDVTLAPGTATARMPRADEATSPPVSTTPPAVKPETNSKKEPKLFLPEKIEAGVDGKLNIPKGSQIKAPKGTTFAPINGNPFANGFNIYPDGKYEFIKAPDRDLNQAKGTYTIKTPGGQEGTFTIEPKAKPQQRPAQDPAPVAPTQPTQEEKPTDVGTKLKNLDKALDTVMRNLKHYGNENDPDFDKQLEKLRNVSKEVTQLIRQPKLRSSDAFNKLSERVNEVIEQLAEKFPDAKKEPKIITDAKKELHQISDALKKLAIQEKPVLGPAVKEATRVLSGAINTATDTVSSIAKEARELSGKALQGLLDLAEKLPQQITGGKNGKITLPSGVTLIGVKTPGATAWTEPGKFKYLGGFTMNADGKYTFDPKEDLYRASGIYTLKTKDGREFKLQVKSPPPISTQSPRQEAISYKSLLNLDKFSRNDIRRMFVKDYLTKKVPTIDGNNSKEVAELLGVLNYPRREKAEDVLKLPEIKNGSKAEKENLVKIYKYLAKLAENMSEYQKGAHREIDEPAKQWLEISQMHNNIASAIEKSIK